MIKNKKKLNQSCGKIPTSVFLVIFLLQAVIPAGFMPAPMSSGWPIQFCPKGLTAATMQVLHGTHTTTMDHANHIGHGQSNTPGENTDQSIVFDCPFAALGSEMVHIYGAEINLAPQIECVIHSFAFNHLRTKKPSLGYLSRAPPKVISA